MRQSELVKDSKGQFDEKRYQMISESKGLAPYLYLDNPSKLAEKALPKKEYWYSGKKEEISEDTYQRCLQYYDTFECENLAHFFGVYGLADTLQVSTFFLATYNVQRTTYNVQQTTKYYSSLFSCLVSRLFHGSQKHHVQFKFIGFNTLSQFGFLWLQVRKKRIIALP